jgi:hypothetical protein
VAPPGCGGEGLDVGAEVLADVILVAHELLQASISRCCDIDSRRDHQLRQFEESML